MPPQLITAPVIDPISLAEAKVHGRIDLSTADPDAYGKLAAARAYIEQITGRALLTSTWDYYLDALPGKSLVELPKGQLQSITSFKYTDSDDMETSWSSANYEADTVRDPGRLVLAYGIQWPSVTLKASNPIVVRFVAGWSSYSGTVDVSSTAISWVSGDKFSVKWVPGKDILIGGSAYTITAITDTENITVASAPGDGSGTAYTANDVPYDLRAAIHLLFSHLYYNREAVVIGTTASISSSRLKLALESLTLNYRLDGFGV